MSAEEGFFGARCGRQPFEAEGLVGFEFCEGINDSRGPFGVPGMRVFGAMLVVDDLHAGHRLCSPAGFVNSALWRVGGEGEELLGGFGWLESRGLSGN